MSPGKKQTKPPGTKAQNVPALTKQKSFSEIVALIEQARQQAYQAVNTELIRLYWQIGGYISEKIESAQWGDGVVDQLAAYIAQAMPGVRGFTRRNLFRMRQFYETYAGDTKVSPLVSQLSWTNHLLIMGQCKRPEEREFYLRLSIEHRWGKRELERQLRASLFERAVLNPPKVAPAVRQMYPEAEIVFKDAYIVEFLDLPEVHSEADLHHGLLQKLKTFLIELGPDFCFIRSEYPLQVGKRDFALDLLFFHRGLNCLVAIELKVDRFEPEYLGKLEFYLEALDRDHRKQHENPAIGLLLCASKDNEVVEYALSRSLSPTLVSEYQTKLPDKRLLASKLHEFYMLDTNADTDEAVQRLQGATSVPKKKAVKRTIKADGQRKSSERKKK